MLFVEILGLEGTGKSSLALSAAEIAPPVDYADFDGNLWIARDRFRREHPDWDGQVHVEEFGNLGEDGKDKKLLDAEWNHVRTWLTKALDQSTGTVVLDTGDYLWSLVRNELITGFREGRDLRPNESEPANAWMEAFAQRVKKSKRLVVLIHRSTHPWEIIGQTGTGGNMWGYNESKQVRARAYSHIAFPLHISLLTGKRVVQPVAGPDGKVGKPTLLLTATFKECKPEPLLNDTAVVNPTMKKVLEKVFPAGIPGVG